MHSKTFFALIRVLMVMAALRPGIAGVLLDESAHVQPIAFSAWTPHNELITTVTA